MHLSMPTLALAGAVATGAAAVWTLPGLAPHAPPLARALGVARTLDDPDAAVALTFDDGPHSEGTQAILKILRVGGAVATFSLIGEDCGSHPPLAAEVA